MAASGVPREGGILTHFFPTASALCLYAANILNLFNIAKTFRHAVLPLAGAGNPPVPPVVAPVASLLSYRTVIKRYLFLAWFLLFWCQTAETAAKFLVFQGSCCRRE